MSGWNTYVILRTKKVQYKMAKFNLGTQKVQGNKTKTLKVQ